MNTHLKKLTFKMYLISAVFLLAITFGIWLLSNSFLSIKVSPRDAMVSVDEEPLGINSFGVGKKRLTIGFHTITVESEDYITSIKRLKFKRGLVSKLNIILAKNPPLQTIAAGGKFLTKGKNPNEIYYLGNNESTIYKTETKFDGNRISTSGYPITNPVLSGIQEIVWSPDRNLALFRKSDGIYLFDFKKYDFVNQTETLWNENVGDMAWAPDNSKIAFYYAPPSGERSLIFSNPTNSKRERIIDFNSYNISDPILKWSPDSEKLLVIPRNEGKSANKLYILNISSKQLIKLTETGGVLDAVFSPDGGKIFYSSVEGNSDGFLTEINIDEEGGNNFAGLKTELGNINFMKNNDQLLASDYSEIGGASIYKYSIKEASKKDFSISFKETGKIKKLLLLNDESVYIFESADGIFAMPAIK